MARLACRSIAGPLSVALLAMSAPAWAEGRLGGGGALDLSLTRIVTALILCLMLAVLAALLIKRAGGRIDLAVLRRGFASALPAARRIDIIESRRMSVHADICLVRCDSREYLILCSAQQQTVIRETDLAAEEDA